MFKGYVSVEGHNHSSVRKSTFDSLKKNQNRIEVPALIKLLRDFRLIAKQNQARTKFLHTTDIQWIKRDLIPSITSMGYMPISVEEVKRIVQKWRRRPMRNGKKEVQYVLEDIDIGGFIQILSRVSLLGFRRLSALQCNLDREAWSSSARRAFRLEIPPPLPTSNGLKFGLRENKVVWSLGSVSSCSFRSLGKYTCIGGVVFYFCSLSFFFFLVLTCYNSFFFFFFFLFCTDPMSRTWQSTQVRRHRKIAAGDGDGDGYNDDDEATSGTHTARAHDLIVCKVAQMYIPKNEKELLIDTISTSIDPYRDTDAISRITDNKQEQYQQLFNSIDVDQSGLIERKELLMAVHGGDDFGR